MPGPVHPTAAAAAVPPQSELHCSSPSHHSIVTLLDLRVLQKTL